MCGDKLFNNGGASRESGFDLRATLGSCLRNFLQADRHSSQLLTNSTTEKATLIKDTYLGHVNWIISDHDLFFDIACQGRINVAVSLKADAILLHTTRFCHR